MRHTTLRILAEMLEATLCCMMIFSSQWKTARELHPWESYLKHTAAWYRTVTVVLLSVFVCVLLHLNSKEYSNILLVIRTIWLNSEDPCND
jgi:hypothetical protein